MTDQSEPASGNHEALLGPSTALLRRQLRFELRHARERSGMTQRAAAQALYGSTSKIIRMESGVVSVAPSDVQVLLRAYGITDEAEISRMVSLADASRRPSPYAKYKRAHSDAAIELFENEAFATKIYAWEPELVPGLFQTPGYTRALMESLNVDPERAELVIEARQLRQRMLSRAQRPRLDFLIGEPVVRRPVGGQEVMAEQLAHLVELSQTDGISLRLLPFSAGPHPRIGDPFTILEFEGDIDNLLYLEIPGGELSTQEDAEKAAAYFDDWLILENIAKKPGEFAHALADLNIT